MTLYVSRLLDIPPLTASAAFASALAGGRVRAGAARLDVLATPSTEPVCKLAPHCSAPARLRFPGPSRGMSIEVEVGVWSDRAVELGIRPVGRIGPIDRYADAGHAVLAVLAGAMHAVLDHEMEAAIEAIFVHPALRERPAPPRP